MYTVLLVEDDITVQKQVLKVLESLAKITIAEDIKSAEVALEKHFDLIVLDLGLPDGDGIELLKSTKTKQPNAEFVVLSGDSDIERKVVSFQLGIHDYITKPFDPRELKIRIESKLKFLEISRKNNSFLQVGDLVLHGSLQKVILAKEKKEEVLDLSSKEFKLLWFYAQKEGSLVTRDDVIKNVWDGVFVDQRTIDSHISKLRKKIKESTCRFSAVYGKGYLFEANI